MDANDGDPVNGLASPNEADIPSFITIDEIADDSNSNIATYGIDELKEVIQIPSTINADGTNDTEALPEMVTVDEVYDSDSSSEGALVIAEQLSRDVEVTTISDLPLSKLSVPDDQQNIFAQSSEKLEKSTSDDPSTAKSEMNLVVVDEIGDNDSCQLLIQPELVVIPSLESLPARSNARNTKSQSTLLPVSNSKLLKKANDVSVIYSESLNSSTGIPTISNTAPVSPETIPHNKACKFSAIAAVPLQISAESQQLPPPVTQSHTQQPTKQAVTLSDVAVLSTRNRAKNGCVATGKKPISAESEKEEGEITSEDEDKKKATVKTNILTASHSRTPSKRNIKRKKSRRLPHSKKSRSNDNDGNTSFVEMLDDHKTRRRRSSVEDVSSSMSPAFSTQTTDSIRVLRIAALRSVAKGKVTDKDNQGTGKSAAAAVLDSTNIDDIVSAVTELPTFPDTKLLNETPSAKLLRKKKWRAMAEKLNKKDGGEQVDTGNAGDRDSIEPIDMDISDDDCPATDDNTDNKEVQSMDDKENSEVSIQLTAGSNQNGVKFHELNAATKAEPFPAVQSGEVSLDEVLHMSFNPTQMVEYVPEVIDLVEEEKFSWEPEAYSDSVASNVKKISRIEKTSQIRAAIRNLGNSQSEKVISGIQQHNIPVSRMTLTELKTELAKVSSLVLQLAEQVKIMKHGKSRTKKKSRITLLAAYKEKLHELVSRRQGNQPTSQKSTNKRVKSSTAEVPGKMAGISGILSLSDPKEQYEMFMSRVGDEHAKIAVPVSEKRSLTASASAPQMSYHVQSAPYSPAHSSSVGAVEHTTLPVAVTSQLSVPAAPPTSSQLHPVSSMPQLRDSETTEMEMLRMQALMSKNTQKKALEMATTVPASMSPSRAGTSSPSRMGLAASPRVVTKASTLSKEVPSLTITKVIKSPKIGPIVIDLGDDSSSEEEAETALVVAGLDSMLKECRLQVSIETKKQSDSEVLSPTSASINLLSANKREEYRMLKEEMERRTKQKRQKIGSTVNPAVSRKPKKSKLLVLPIIKAVSSGSSTVTRDKALDRTHTVASAAQVASTATVACTGTLASTVTVANTTQVASTFTAPRTAKAAIVAKVTTTGSVASTTPMTGTATANGTSTVASTAKITTSPRTAKVTTAPRTASATTAPHAATVATVPRTTKVTSALRTATVTTVSCSPTDSFSHTLILKHSAKASKERVLFSASPPKPTEKGCSTESALSSRLVQAAVGPVPTTPSSQAKAGSSLKTTFQAASTPAVAISMLELSSVEEAIKNTEIDLQEKSTKLALLKNQMKAESEMIRKFRIDLAILEAKKLQIVKQAKQASPMPLKNLDSSAVGDNHIATAASSAASVPSGVDNNGSNSWVVEDSLISMAKSQALQSHTGQVLPMSSARSKTSTYLKSASVDLKSVSLKSSLTRTSSAMTNTSSVNASATSIPSSAFKTTTAGTKPPLAILNTTSSLKTSSSLIAATQKMSTPPLKPKLALADAAELYEPMGSTSTETSTYSPTPITINVENDDSAYDPQLSEVVNTTMTAYQPTPIPDRAFGDKLIADPSVIKSKTPGFAGGAESERRMKALERAMSIKLRSKYIKKQQKAAAKSEDVIPVPKLPRSDVVDQPPAKRRRSLLDPPSPKARKQSTPPSTSDQSSAPVDQRVRQMLMHELAALPQAVQYLRSDAERLNILPSSLPQEHPALRSSVRVLTGNEECSMSRRHHRSEKYTSALKVFKTYRLSPYMKLQEKVSPLSATFNHALDPNLYLCKYDLHGSCNDSSCEHQHERDYKLSIEQIVENLRAISKHKFQETARGFVKRCRTSQFTPMSDDQIVLIGTAQVCSTLEDNPPFAVQFETKEANLPLFDSSATVTTDRRPQQNYAMSGVTSSTGSGKKGVTGSDLLSDDGLVFCTDTRYYLDNASSMEEMEKLLVDDPCNVSMWMKLVYQKLHENRHSTEAVYEALHIVSLALESNSTNLDLWLLYLKLYGKQRPADRPDYADICEKALSKQPCYQVFILYIDALPSANMKLEACSHVKTFLITPDNAMTEDEKSFAMLQILMYNTSLALMSGHASKSMLKNILAQDNEERKLLTASDWLLAVYYSAYVTAFQCFPPSLVQGMHLTSREALPINWSKADMLPATREEVQSMLSAGITETSSDQSMDCTAHWALRRAFLELENRVEAGSISRSWLKENNNTQIPEFYLMYLNNQRHTDPQHFRKLCENCVHTLPLCAKVSFYISLWTEENTTGMMDKLEFTVKLIYSLFEISIIGQGAVQHAGHLYRVLLDLEHAEKIPLLSSSNRESPYKENTVYCWLCYGYYLEAYGSDSETIIDMYEMAMSRMIDRNDVQLVCWRYIEYRTRLVLKYVASEVKMKEYLGVVTRLLCSVPVKFQTADKKNYSDFSFHNKVIRYVADVMHQSDVISWYEQWMKKYPDNVQLLPRLCESYLSSTDYMSIRQACQVLIMKSQPSETLWNMYINATLRMQDTQEALAIAGRAVKLMPHSVLLWKKYLTIMLSVSTPISDLRRAIKECQDSDVNLESLPTELKSYLR